MGDWGYIALFVTAGSTIMFGVTAYLNGKLIDAQREYIAALEEVVRNG